MSPLGQYTYEPKKSNPSKNADSLTSYNLILAGHLRRVRNLHYLPEIQRLLAWSEAFRRKEKK